jgi:hypothetical protein
MAEHAIADDPDWELIMNIMISYSHNDAEKVDTIQTCLERFFGGPVWRDTTHMGPGEDWRETLLKKPTTVDAFIPFLSENYVNSEICRMELFLARATERHIFPVMLTECWDCLDTKEETKHISALFAARMQALKIVSLPVTKEQLLERFSQDIISTINNSNRTAYNTYISYPGQSGPFATHIRNRLRDVKIKPWIATLDCRFGSDWRKSQVNAMVMAKAHIIVISSEFVKSNNDVLQTEILMSESLGLPIFGVEEPELKELKEHSRVSSFLRNGEQVFRRITNRNWYKEKDLDKLKEDISVKI